MTDAIRPGRADRVATLPPRERILDAAEALFYAQGIRGVSVQTIADKAGTTKAALYRHFGTKDALVAQWLSIVAADYAVAFDRIEQRWPHDPKSQIRGVAKFIAEGLSTISHRGCPFVNSIAELPDHAHPARQVIEAHKARQFRRIAAMCASAGFTDPERTAAGITFVLEGAQVCAQNGSMDRVGDRVVALVEAMVTPCEQ